MQGDDQGTDTAGMRDAEVDAYGLRFPLQEGDRVLTVLVPFETLHKAEAAFANGPVDQDYRVALERYRSVFEEIARRKQHDGAIEPGGTIRVTSDDLSQLGR